MDAKALAEFLRSRRQALQPEDIGMPRGLSRRTPGLRREEVATQSSISPDYYGRLERGVGHRPSEVMLAILANALRLEFVEREYLFRLCGYEPPVSQRAVTDEPDPGLIHVLDQMRDTPAAIVTGLGETLRQSSSGVVLFGDETRFTGHSRCAAYRWFTDPVERHRYPVNEHTRQSRIHVSQLRSSTTWPSVAWRTAEVVSTLERESREFAELWVRHEIGLYHGQRRRLVHPRVGELELRCQIVFDPDRVQALLIYTADRGSTSARRLADLAAD